jgi:hypothetical protein
MVIGLELYFVQRVVTRFRIIKFRDNAAATDHKDYQNPDHHSLLRSWSRWVAIALVNSLTAVLQSGGNIPQTTSTKPSSGSLNLLSNSSFACL